MTVLQDCAVYILVNCKSGTVLDLSAGDFVTVHGWNRHGGDNQKWKAIHHDGKWHLRNVAFNKYLGLANKAKDDVAAVGTEQAFEWEICDGHTGKSNELRVIAPGTTFTLDLTGYGNAANGTPVKVWGGPPDFQTKPKLNQIWRFERV